jgi:hypothetical protein
MDFSPKSNIINKVINKSVGSTNTLITQTVTKTSRKSTRLFYSVDVRRYLNIFVLIKPGF